MITDYKQWKGNISWHKVAKKFYLCFYIAYYSCMYIFMVQFTNTCNCVHHLNLVLILCWLETLPSRSSFAHKLKRPQYAVMCARHGIRRQEFDFQFYEFSFFFQNLAGGKKTNICEFQHFNKFLCHRTLISIWNKLYFHVCLVVTLSW